jgi:hypothetical protein
MFTQKDRLFTTAVLIVMAAGVCSAQSITSAHSGTVHYFQGDVSIDGVQLESKAGRFAEIKEQSILRTALGRAEVLLTPGVFLRVGENSEIKMLDNRLANTRVEMLSGIAMIEADDPQMSVKDSPVTLIYKDYEIQMVKHGLVEVSSGSAQVKVYKGEALVTAANAAGNNHVVVKDGHVLDFTQSMAVTKFDDKNADDLYVWSRDRSQALSTANMSSARTLNPSGAGYGFAGAGAGGWNGGWYYNPSFGMFTYVPVAGTLWNPWGYGFFSPLSIYDYYAPVAYWYGGGNALGRPINGFLGGSKNNPAPISRLTGGATPPALGSPIRNGRTVPGAGFSAPGGSIDAGAAPALGPSRGSLGGGAAAGGGMAGGGIGGAGTAHAAGPAMGSRAGGSGTRGR